MKKIIPSLFMLSLLSLLPLNAEETPAPSVEIGKVSEAFGHLIRKNLDNVGVKFDMAQVMKGLQDSINGKESPMTEMECIQAIAAVQEKIFKEQCVENLKRADSFLADNAKTKGVISLEKGKVQYLVTTQGAGNPVADHDSPLIKYTGKFLDGSVFGSSKEEEKISLDEIIPGLKAGLLGMKEGEKRTVYIHPDLAYGVNGQLPPNSLLTFDVEIVKANMPMDDEVEMQENREIAEAKSDIR